MAKYLGGWKKVEIEEIRLVYTPYRVFSFDVLAEGGQPSSPSITKKGKGALLKV